MDWDTKVLCVAGIPSGGTSCMAGTLLRLGVDLGKCITYERRAQSRRRNYDTYECQQRRRFSNLQEYIQHRLTTLGRHAWKGGCWKISPEEFLLPDPIPIEFISVTRDINRIKISCKRYHDGLFQPIFQRSLTQLYQVHPPLLTVKYEDLVSNPEEQIVRMIDVLNLSPTDQQIQEALTFIDPVACKEKRK